MSENPIDEIEQARAMNEMGVAGFRIFHGAREAGASRVEACTVLAAWYFSLTLGGHETEN